MPSGTLVVKSRAYGVHQRAVRGSETLVVINEALQRNVANTVDVNNLSADYELYPFAKGEEWEMILIVVSLSGNA